MREVRANPPLSVNDIMKMEMYRVLYDDITSNGTEIQWSDRHTLGDLAVAMVEKNNLVDELETKGESYESQGDRNKIERKNPSRVALEKLRPHILALQREFKMTPNSRKSQPTITPNAGGIKDDGWDDI